MLSNLKPRMTPQRRAILEALRNTDSHPTADEVYEIVRRRLPRISLGTVYRNLEILSESGMIQKLELGGHQKRFDSRTENHYHVRCIRCGRVEDVPLKPVSAVEDVFRGVCDYQIIGHQLILFGLCPECRERDSQKVQRKEK